MTDENNAINSANQAEENLNSPSQQSEVTEPTPSTAPATATVAAPVNAAPATMPPAANSYGYRPYSTAAQQTPTYSTYGTGNNTPYSPYQQATASTPAAPASPTYGNSAQTSYPYTPVGQQYNTPPQKSKSGGNIVLVAICIILSLICGMVGSMIDIGQGGNDTITPIEIPFTGNPWADVSEALLESTVWIYAEGYGGAWTGSGVVISSDGYVLTNHHVANGADYIEVIFYSEEFFIAEVITMDSKNDLALLKIDATGLRPVRIGNSDAVRVGDEVLGIGNQLGMFPDTVANGIISHLPQTTQYEGIYSPMCFQMNIAIMPGNSGGGMFNHQGDLVGINSAGYGVMALAPDNLVAPEISYSITINLAIDLVRGALGADYISDDATLDIQLTEISDKTAAQNNGYNDVGVYITEVGEYGPAYLAGLKKDDRIVSVGSKIIISESDFSSAMNSSNVGDYVQVTVERGGQQYIYTIQLSREIAG